MEKEITAIERQKKNSKRVNIFLENEFGFGLQKFVSIWLRVGQKLSDTDIEKLQYEDSIEIAYQKGIKLLSYRPRSEQEMFSRLSKYGFEDEVIDKVIVRMKDYKLLDDVQFARLWIENRTQFRPRGRRLLKLELRQKMVDSQIIENALNELPEESEIALSAARKYARKLNGLKEEQFKKRLYGFLARRGFNYSDVKPIIKNIWNEFSDASKLLENEVLKDG